MKKRLFLASAATAVILCTALSGCGKSTGPEATTTPFEVQHKTENETENYRNGIFPQVFEKSVTYVQKVQDGAWEVETEKTTKWSLGDTSDLPGSSWTIEVADTITLDPELEEYKGVPATVYLHFGKDMGEIKAEPVNNPDTSSKMAVSFDTIGDTFFVVDGTRFPLNEIRICGAEISRDGSMGLTIDYGEGRETIVIPSDASPIEWEAYMKKKSTTFFTKTDFMDLPSFNVSSNMLHDWIWDIRITKTVKGENVNPDLTWDAVDGATQYAVIMIDGAWLHMDYYTTETSLAEGGIDSDLRTKAGKRYVGPYPPLGSTHTYSVFVFALKSEAGKVQMNFDNGGNSINTIYEGLNTDKDGNTGNVIAYGRLDGNYTQEVE